MTRNAYELYEAYNNLPYEKLSLYYLKKVAFYSHIDKKIDYLLKLASHYKMRNKKAELL